MPKFAANLTKMFNEVAFSERFAAAAKADFAAVEFLFPFNRALNELARRLIGNRLFEKPFNDQNDLANIEYKLSTERE